MAIVTIHLTYESVDKVLSYDHSNEAFSAVLLNDTGVFSVFYKKRLGIFRNFVSKIQTLCLAPECKSTAESRLHAIWVSAPIFTGSLV